MFAKVFLGAMLVVAISARSIDWNKGVVYVIPYGQFEIGQPEYLHRVRRQAQSSITYNSDGSTGLANKVRVAGDDQNVLSAIGTMHLNNQKEIASKGFGLAVDNANGHGLTMMKETVTGFGDKVTGTGKLNVFHNDNHDVNAHGFLTRNMPNADYQVPNFNTFGGGLDYMYKDKVGASVSMASTPFLDRKDYSATGNLNLFRTPTSSLNLNAGFDKFETPSMSSSWEPKFGLTFSRSF